MDQHAKKSSPGGDKKISDDIINRFEMIVNGSTPRLPG